MRHLTVSVDDDLAEAFDRLIEEEGYRSRSEAFRDLLRLAFSTRQLGETGAKECVGVLSYVYDHHEHQLSSRLTQMQHDHHEVTVSTMHAHLDHDTCVETVILRGALSAVSVFANSVIAQRGVRHGHFHPIPAESVAATAKKRRRATPNAPG